MRDALLCEIAGARFALPIEQVREVVTLESLTPVPSAPPPVRGVTQIRGRILAVVDLGALLGLPARALSPGDRLVRIDLADGGAECLLDAGTPVEVRAGDAPGAGAARPVDAVGLLRALALSGRGSHDPLARVPRRRKRASPPFGGSP